MTFLEPWHALLARTGDILDADCWVRDVSVEQLQHAVIHAQDFAARPNQWRQDSRLRFHVSQILRFGPPELERRAAVEVEARAVAAAQRDHRAADDVMTADFMSAFRAAAYTAAARALLAAPAPKSGSLVLLPVWLDPRRFASGLIDWDLGFVAVVREDEHVRARSEHQDGVFLCSVLAGVDGEGAILGAGGSLSVHAERFTSKAGYQRSLAKIVAERAVTAAGLPELSARLAASVCPCCAVERGPVLAAAIRLLMAV